MGKLVSKRFDRGAYEVSYRGRNFTVESEAYRYWASGDPKPSYVDPNDWVVVEKGDDLDWDGYWNHFVNKWSALEAIKAGVDEGEFS